MKVIFASNGEKILVDESRYEELNKFKWFIDGDGYARRKKRKGENYKTTHVAMHHVVARFEGGRFTIVDHKNRNKLDNRESNLQVTTRAVNKINSKIQSNSTTGYKGVCFRKSKNYYEVYIGFEGKKMYLGSYKTAEEGALAYNKKAQELYGVDAVLNEVKYVKKINKSNESKKKLKRVSRS